MKVALVNPPWDFTGSIYFGCREPHFPLELGYAKALLEQNGHSACLIDASLLGLSLPQVRAELTQFGPQMTVIPTAPSYLFWRCAPPELRIPKQAIRALRPVGGRIVAVGPHGSTTPRATLHKLDADVVVLGECEEVLCRLAESSAEKWSEIGSIAYQAQGKEVVQGRPYSCNMRQLPALRWPAEFIQAHSHHHHRFESAPQGPGAEVEFSRGCPYQCAFCAKENYRNQYRKRPVSVVIDEIDALLSQGVRYIYFIDEIFLPDRELLEALAERDVAIGCQLRIDTWSGEELELLGRAGCVSIEAGVESITPEGRSLLGKRCRLSTEQLTELLIKAKKHVPFVQANLLDGGTDSPQEVESWREHLQKYGVWANKPVPMFLYPGSPGYTKRWGMPDDFAWERALESYLSENSEFSDIQEACPQPLDVLEASHG